MVTKHVPDVRTHRNTCQPPALLIGCRFVADSLQLGYMTSQIETNYIARISSSIRRFDRSSIAK